MGNLFGKSTKGSASAGSRPANGLTDKDHAVLELKRQRDRLHKYKQKITAVLEKETSMAKQLYKEGKKTRAILALRKKKYQEKLLANTDNQMFNIEQLMNSIEWAVVQQRVVQALEQGNIVLQKLNEEMDLDKVSQIMEDSAEAIAYQEEVNRLMGASLNPEDEALIEAEYDRLSQLSEPVGTVLPSDLPSVPVRRPVVSEPEEAVEPVAEEKATPVVVLSA